MKAHYFLRNKYNIPKNKSIQEFLGLPSPINRKDMKISEIPDRWVIVKLPNSYYKVFGTWTGGYLDGDRWKINSGIKKVEQDEDFYYFTGFSGSCYKCHKKAYGVASSWCSGILNNIMEKGKITLMDDNDDWVDFINSNQ